MTGCVAPVVAGEAVCAIAGAGATVKVAASSKDNSFIKAYPVNQRWRFRGSPASPGNECRVL